MKLVYLATIRLPTEKAHGLQIMKTCEALARQGVEVELVVPARKTNISEDVFSYYNVESNLFPIRKLKVFDFIGNRLLGAVGYWITSWIFFRKCLKYLRARNFDLVYTRDLTLAYWLLKNGFKVIYEIHTLPGIANRHYQYVWREAKGLAVISAGLKADLIKFGVTGSKILVAHDAVDVKEFSISASREDCRRKLDLPLDKKIVVYTGHLYEWKGAGTLAEAAGILPDDVRVYLVGGTAEDIKNFRLKYKAPNLKIVGFRPHAEIPYWLRAADVLVLPNSAKNDNAARYTSPLKAFEYMLSGNIIVAADVPALHEVFGDSEVIFFKPDDPHALAAIIERVCNSTPRPRDSGGLRAKCERDYTWDARAKRLVDFIREKTSK